MMRISFAAVLTALLPMTAGAAVPNVLWEKKYDVENLAVGAGKVDSRGDLVLVGRVSTLGSIACPVALKLSGTTGAELWRRSYCEAQISTASTIAIDANDNIVLAGQSYATASPSNQIDVRILKLTTDGAPIWDVRYPRPNVYGGAQHMALDSAGNIYVLASGQASTALNVFLEPEILKYSAGGTLLWKQPGYKWTARFLVGPSGDLFVTGSVEVETGFRARVMRLRSSDGTTLWTAEEAVASTANFPALDAAGNLFVAGTLGPGTSLAMRTVKYNGANGTVIWRRDVEPTEGTLIAGIVVDSKGNPVAIGHSGKRFRTVKYAGADGVILWQASYVGNGVYDVPTRVSINNADEVTVSGYVNGGPNGSPAYDHTDLRTLRYDANGKLLWSTGYGGNAGTPGVTPVTLLDVGDATYEVAWGNGTAYLGTATRVVKYGRQVIATPSYQGLWWASPPGSESGWGLNLAHQGDKLFGTWFTYDSSGNPTWWVMSDLQNIEGNVFRGTANVMRGPAFSSTPFDSSQVAPVSGGQAKFTFSGPNLGMFEFTESGSTTAVNKEITQLIYASPAADCRLDGDTAGRANYQDLWWAAPGGSESGWGLNIAHHGDILFATWFTYDENRRAMWYVASNLQRQGDGSYSGAVDRTVGTWSRSGWDPAKFHQTPVGSARVAFSGDNSGRFSYTIGNVVQQKPITRFSFSSPPTRCH